MSHFRMPLDLRDEDGQPLALEDLYVGRIVTTGAFRVDPLTRQNTGELRRFVVDMIDSEGGWKVTPEPHK